MKELSGYVRLMNGWCFKCNFEMLFLMLDEILAAFSVRCGHLGNMFYNDSIYHCIDPFNMFIHKSDTNGIVLHRCWSPVLCWQPSPCLPNADVLTCPSEEAIMTSEAKITEVSDRGSHACLCGHSEWTFLMHRCMVGKFIIFVNK